VEQWLVPVAIGALGSAGLVGLLTFLRDMSRPARLRRRSESIAAVRDHLPEGSEARARLDNALELTATALADDVSSTAAAESAIAPKATVQRRREAESRSAILALLTVVVFVGATGVAIWGLASDEQEPSTAVLVLIGALLAPLLVVAMVAVEEWRWRRSQRRQYDENVGQA
jgi:hypothetical protein